MMYTIPSENIAKLKLNFETVDLREKLEQTYCFKYFCPDAKRADYHYDDELANLMLSLFMEIDGRFGVKK